MAVQREHYPPAWHWWGVIGALGFFLAVTVVAMVVAAAEWVRLFLSLCTAMGALALVELRLRRVVLHDDDVEIRTSFRQKRVARSRIAGVTWEKGSGVALKLVDGSWLPLPEVGRGSQSLANSIRAWLKT